MSNPASVDLEFTPVPSLAGLFSADPAVHRFIFALGPIGSTKTTTILHFLLAKAAMQEASPDGYRRSRFALIRSTVTSLVQTLLKDILNLFGGVVEWRPSVKTVFVDVGDIKSEWILLPLDTPDDIRRLLSLQLSGVYVNEAREVPWDLITQAYSRTGRYPSTLAGGVNCTHRFLVADSNLGVEGSAMWEFLEVTKSPSTLYLHQPDALSPEADWLQYLPQGYYQDIMIGASAQFIRQHVHAQWGMDLSGEPVYGSSYSRNWHVSPVRLKPFPDRPLVVGIDPGLNPAMVVAQLSGEGQLRILAEAHASNLLFRPFIDKVILPILQVMFPLFKMIFIVDPAGGSRTAMSADTAIGVLEAYDFTVLRSPTNELAPRLRGVERWLTTSIGDQPGLVIDPICVELIRGFEGAYRYVRDSKGELNPKPEKKHPVSDIHDSLQYIALGLSGKKGTRLSRDQPWHRQATNPGEQGFQAPIPWRGR